MKAGSLSKANADHAVSFLLYSSLHTRTNALVLIIVIEKFTNIKIFFPKIYGSDGLNLRISKNATSDIPRLEKFNKRPPPITYYIIFVSEKK